MGLSGSVSSRLRAFVCDSSFFYEYRGRHGERSESCGSRCSVGREVSENEAADFSLGGRCEWSSGSDRSARSSAGNCDPETQHDGRSVARAQNDGDPGMPAIGVAAAYGMFLAARTVSPTSQSAVLIDVLKASGAYLQTARITSVNLEWAIAQMVRVAISERAIGVRQLQRGSWKKRPPFWKKTRRCV